MIEFMDCDSHLRRQIYLRYDEEPTEMIKNYRDPVIVRNCRSALTKATITSKEVPIARSTENKTEVFKSAARRFMRGISGASGEIDVADRI